MHTNRMMANTSEEVFTTNRSIQNTSQVFSSSLKSSADTVVSAAVGWVTGVISVCANAVVLVVIVDTCLQCPVTEYSALSHQRRLHRAEYTSQAWQEGFLSRRV